MKNVEMIKSHLVENDRSFFEDLFENATAMSAVTDKDGFIILVNKKGLEMFFGQGYDIRNVLGKNIIEIIHKDDREKVIQLWKQSITEKKEVNYDIRMSAPDGRVMYFLISGRPIIREGEVVAFQYQALDIIDQKVQEQSLLQATSIEVLAQIAGGFAHDFNNMLTVINGYSEILRMSIDETHPFHNKVTQICQAGKQASMLTQRMLDFSRSNKIQVKPMDINEEISNQEGIIKHVIGEKINLIIVKTPGLNTVTIDPSRFATLLVNLVINAKEAMPKGGEVTISTDRVAINAANESSFPQVQHGDYLLLTVKDTGEGMSYEVQKQIFDPFFSTRGGGKGIGLWTVQNIVKASRGCILVESIPGAGTTFKVLFPFSSVETRKEQETKIEANVQSTDKESKTILVVEDDDTVRDLVSEILKQQGHTTLTARNGGDALQLARQLEGRIDLLITDMVMRRIDGRMLSKKIKSIWPHIKVMIMSGYGTDVIKEEDIKDNTFLQKPFLPQELVDKVHSVLQS